MAEYKSKFIGEQIDEGIDRAFALSNRNLLINYDWRTQAAIVNQRGLLEYTGTGYGIDGWRISIGKLKLTNEGIEFTTNEEGDAVLMQKLEFPQQYAGKTLTVSAEMQSKTGQRFRVYTRASVSGTLSYGWGNTVSSDGVSVGTITVPEGVTELYTAVQMLSADRQTAGTVLLKRVKLELGEVSTLANDPPQDYGVELAKCQRYQFVLRGNISNRIRNSYISASNIDFPMPVPQTLRTTPAIVPITGSLQIVSGLGNTTPIEGFTFSVMEKTDGFITIRANKSAHGLTEALLQMSNSGSVILLDANL